MTLEKCIGADQTGFELQLCHLQAWRNLGKISDFFFFFFFVFLGPHLQQMEVSRLGVK